jgi:hypothetical protein
MEKFAKITKFASEVSTLDKNDIIKTANFLNRLKNWYKSVFDSEYKEQIQMMMETSSEIKIYSDRLQRYLDLFDKSIKEKDVDLYNYAIEQIEWSIFSLADILRKNKESLKKIQVSENEFQRSQYEKPKQERQKFVYFSETVKKKMVQYLNDELLNKGIDKKEILDIISNSQTLKDIEKAILEGNIINVEPATAPSKNENREGEEWITIHTNPFKLSTGNVVLQFYAYLVDLSKRKIDPENKLSLRYIDNLSIHKSANLKNKIIKSAGTIANVPGIKNKSEEFLTELVRVGNRLGIDPNWLAAIMSAESNFQADAVNKLGGATGLIQFVNSTAKQLGTSLDELKMMSDVEQLHFVEKFYKPWSGKIKSPGDLYMATFLPVFVGHPPNTIVGKKGSTKKITKNLTYGKVYELNFGLDTDKDGIIRASDVTSRVDSRLRSAQKLPPIPVKEELERDALRDDLFPKENVKEDSGFWSNIFDKVMSFLGMKTASNDIESIVKKAVYKQKLPTNIVKIKLSSENFEDNVSCGFILAEALDNTLLSDSEILSDGKNIEVISSMSGSLENVVSASIGVSNIVLELFNKKYNTKISKKISDNINSSFEKLSYEDIEKQKRKFFIKTAGK